MLIRRRLLHFAPLAALALLIPAACGGTAQQEAGTAGAGGTRGAGGAGGTAGAGGTMGTGGAPPSGADGTSCDQAIDITEMVTGGDVYSGKATAEGDFKGLCASQKGRIEYLRFDAMPGNYRITLSGPSDDAALTAVLDVRTDCASPASEIGCDPHAVSPPTLVGVDKAGTVFLVLSGDWYGKGYEIRVEPAMPCTADFDCAQSYPQTRCDTTSGACYAPLACAAGTADCDADPDDGCETDTTKDTANCGVCGVSCQGPNVKSGTCAASSCVLTCDTGFADCDEEPNNGCETYLLGDGANCGACGHDCMHGGCAASTCTAPPVALGTTGTISPDGPIALDASNVYVAGELSSSMGGVISVPKSGGAATLLVNDDCNVASLVVDAGTVYWAGRDCSTVDAAIKSAPIAGGATTVLASDPSSILYPAGLLADATTLYWYDVYDSTVLALPKAGGEVTIVANVQNANGAMQILALAADATALYFTARDYIANTTALYSVPKSSGTPKMLAALPVESSGQLAISGTDLYVATDTNIAHIATTGGSLTPFASANLGSADPTTTLAVTSLAIAGGNLYWSEGATSAVAFCPTPGGIWKIPLSGGPAVGLASDESPGPIAADASGVYMSATCSGGIALQAGP